jgi:septum formation topological specificity factor MinE
MKLKWLGLTFILFLAAFVAQKDYAVAPNQEISLQLEGKVTSSHETLRQFKVLLEPLGVENISISENEKGELTISYFSELEVGEIQKVLQKALQVSQESIKVTTIKKDQSSSSGFNGKILAERKTEADRFVVSYLNALLKVKDSYLLVLEGFAKVSVSTETEKQASNTLHNIPEVRAGPIFI